MLDALPPPSVYEEIAPSWVRTQSGLLLPEQPSKKAVLPGLMPTMMLSGGSFGMAQMPPLPTPTGALATINSVGLGTANPAVATSAATAAISQYSEILVWAFVRHNILNDPTTPVLTITDSQGGTYSRIGTSHRMSFNNGSNHTFWGGLYRRNAAAPAGGLPAMTITMSSAWSGSNSSTFLSCYAFEIRNQYNLPVHIEERLAVPYTVAANLSMTNTGDVYCLDFYAGAGGVANESANSGFTSIVGAATFVSSNLRLQIYDSGYQAQSSTRTVPANVTYGGVAASFAIYYDTVRSAGEMIFEETDYKQATVYANSTAFTINLGAPAPDRQVIIYVGGSADASSAVQFTTINCPGPDFERLGNSGAVNNSGAIFWNLVPTGTTLDITVNGTGAPFPCVHVYTLKGCKSLISNQKDLTVSGAGTNTPGGNFTQANSQNAPFQWIETRYIPAGAIALGGGGSRTGVTNILTNQAHSWTPTGTGYGFAMGAYRKNPSKTLDELVASYGISYSGTIAAHMAVMNFGP